MAIKTFRGLLAHGEQLEINLRTNDGKTGYMIKTFSVIGNNPQVGNQESVVKVFKGKQTTINGLINFSDHELLGVGVFKNYGAVDYNMNDHIVFDSEIFNQDIYITHTDEAGSTLPCNYYLELEQVKLNDNESTMTTLQSIRSRYEAYTPAGPT